MRKVDSLEKPLMLGKIEGKRRSGWQRVRWLDNNTDSRDMSLSKLWEIVKGRAAINAVAKSRAWLNNWTQQQQKKYIYTPVLLVYIYIYIYQCYSLNLSHPLLPCVWKSVLCICVSIPALQIGMVQFWFPNISHPWCLPIPTPNLQEFANWSPVSILTNLGHILRTAARGSILAQKSDHVPSRLKTLHWLPHQLRSVHTLGHGSCVISLLSPHCSFMSCSVPGKLAIWLMRNTPECSCLRAFTGAVLPAWHASGAAHLLKSLHNVQAVLPHLGLFMVSVHLSHLTFCALGWPKSSFGLTRMKFLTKPIFDLSLVHLLHWNINSTNVGIFILAHFCSLSV